MILRPMISMLLLDQEGGGSLGAVASEIGT
jgi:hypothetical protein